MTGHHHTHRTPTDQLHDRPDDQLLALWVGGHREGLDELAARHHGWMLRLVRQLSHGEHDPEAVVQDAWLDVIRTAASFRGDGTVRAWLATIVRRRIGTSRRARDAGPQTLAALLPEDSTTSGEIENGVVLRADLSGLLARLPRDQCEAIWWVDVLGLPVEDAATLMGVAAGTVKSRCHRGRTRLRLILQTGG
jgi:RNA polymerase sigma-70 factor (ECF subfamily)